MLCEICGKYIVEGKKVMVEGSNIITCESCASYGKIVSEIKRKETRKKDDKIESRPFEVDFDVEIQEEIVDNYQEIIKKARESRNMKQEDLAKMINEPVSMIHRIESGRMEPSLGVVKKIQRKLNIKLIKKPEAESTNLKKVEFPKEITLGDLVVVKKKKK